MNALLREAFASMRFPVYRIYWFAVMLNFSGLWFAIVARGFLTFRMTESSAALGALFLAFGAPQLLLTLPGGVLADRLPRRPVILVGQAVVTLNTLILGALMVGGQIEFWMLLVSSAIDGSTVALAVPTRQAMIGDMVDAESLGNGVALQHLSFNGARVIAPLIAGATIAIEAVDVGGTYLIAGALFGMSGLVFMRLPLLPRAVPASVRTSPRAALIEGFAYVRRRPALLVLVLTSYAIEATVFPYFAFIPAVVADVFDRGSFALGLMTSVGAIGALLASVGVAAVADQPRGWQAHMLSTLSFCALVIAFALSPTFAVALVVVALVGAAEVGFLSLNQSLAMRYSDPQFFGRVQALLLVGFALLGVAAYPLGLLADAIGIRQTLVGQGVVAIAVMIAILAYGRRIGAAADTRPPRRSEPVAPPA